MKLRVGIGLLFLAAAASAADLTWTSLQTVESSMALPSLPPSTTVIQTMSGGRSGLRRGDQVTITDGETITTVDYVKREYYQTTLSDMLAMGTKATESLKGIPGFQTPKMTLKPRTAAVPGPTILGVPTTVQHTELAYESEMAIMKMAMNMDMEVAVGKPDGWEAMVAVQPKGQSPLSDQYMGQLSAMLGPDAVKQLSQNQVTGMPMRTRMSMKTTVTPGADSPVPAMPAIEMTMTTEVTSISKQADLTMLEIPAGFKQVPAPGLPSSPAPKQ